MFFSFHPLDPLLYLGFRRETPEAELGNADAMHNLSKVTAITDLSTRSALGHQDPPCLYFLSALPPLDLGQSILYPVHSSREEREERKADPFYSLGPKSLTAVHVECAGL